MRARVVVLAVPCVATWLVAPLAAPAQPTPRPPMPALPPRHGSYDFEFAVGRWKVADWRWRGRVHPDSAPTSYIVDAVAAWRPLADGSGLLEDYEVTGPVGARVRHATLLAYDAYSQQWIIHRSDGVPYDVDGSVRGGFVCREPALSCEGEFAGLRSDGGRTALVRETIRVSQPNAWEWIRQLSRDGGTTWETVRHRRYTRIGVDSARRTAAPEPRPVRATYCCARMELRRYSVPDSGERVLRRLFADENVLASRMVAQHRARSGAGMPPDDLEIRWMENLALLRDVDHPRSYVWLRGLVEEPNDLPFYFSSAWQAHEDAVRQADIRTTDAHLVESWLYGGAFVVGLPTRTDPVRHGLIVANVYTLPAARLLELQYLFSYIVVPALSRTGGRPIAHFRSSSRWQFQQELSRVFGQTSSPDTGIFVWFTRFPSADAYGRHLEALQRDTTWSRAVRPRLEQIAARPPEVWRLEPVVASRPIL